MAERFARGKYYAREVGFVWQATVEPWRLFAHDNGRGEEEYVVDTTGLAIAKA